MILTIRAWHVLGGKRRKARRGSRAEILLYMRVCVLYICIALCFFTVCMTISWNLKYWSVFARVDTGPVHTLLLWSALVLKFLVARVVNQHKTCVKNTHKCGCDRRLSCMNKHTGYRSVFVNILYSFPKPLKHKCQLMHAFFFFLSSTTT